MVFQKKSMFDNNWIDNIRVLTADKKWKEILSEGRILSIAEKSRILWVWPTESNIIFLRNIFYDIKINGILSIGCGSGLLEWILQESTGLPIAGIEISNSWWTSKHCPQPFIKLNFLQSNQTISSEFLQQCMNRNDWQFSMLFCYFNDKPAFLEYLNAYKGSCLIIIGPIEGSGRHTDPSPFQLDTEILKHWSLYNSCKVGNTNDFIAIYLKINKI